MTRGLDRLESWVLCFYRHRPFQFVVDVPPLQGPVHLQMELCRGPDARLDPRVHPRVRELGVLTGKVDSPFRLCQIILDMLKLK